MRGSKPGSILRWWGWPTVCLVLRAVSLCMGLGRLVTRGRARATLSVRHDDLLLGLI